MTGPLTGHTIRWLQEIVPHHVRIGSGGLGQVSISGNSDDDGHVVVDMKAILEQPNISPAAAVSLALHSVLAAVQDFVVETDHRPWPCSENGVMALPRVEVVQQEVRAGFSCGNIWIRAMPTFGLGGLAG